MLEVGKRYTSERTQTWEALSGAGEIEVDGEVRDLRAGDRVILEPGTPHRDPYLPGEGEFQVRGSFDPNTPFIDAYAEAWAHHMREGTVNDQDEMPLIPSVGRLRGFKPKYD